MRDPYADPGMMSFWSKAFWFILIAAVVIGGLYYFGIF